MSASGWAARPRSLALVLVLGACFSVVGTANGQGADPIPAIRSGARVLVDMSTLARRYGWSVSAAADTYTARTGGGILTLFASSSEALWQPVAATEPTSVPMTQPPQVQDGTWYVPVDALEVLAIDVTSHHVAVPNGTAPLSFPPQAVGGVAFDVVDLGNGVRAVRLFQAGPAGRDALSMMVADLALLALAVPEQKDVLDRALTDGPMADDHPLLITVTALEPLTWDATLVFEQDGLRFEARHPFRFQLAEGDANAVAPDRPAIGVALLPARFSLEAPMTVRWGDVVAEVTFRPGR